MRDRLVGGHGYRRALGRPSEASGVSLMAMPEPADVAFVRGRERFLRRLIGRREQCSRN
jgi:hypothetical protein